MNEYKEIHPSVQNTENTLRWLTKIDHLPPHLQEVARHFADLGTEMCWQFSGPEVGAGLRKLLEAKDCFVRAAVAESGDDRERVTGVFMKDSPKP